MFDQTASQVESLDATPPETLLSPAVADLAPRERLERLRLWLLNPEYGNGRGWDYRDLNFTTRDCGTAACALGWYDALVTKNNQQCTYGAVDEFGISHDQATEIFLNADDVLDKNMRDVTPADVAAVIGMVQRGEIT